MQTINRSPFRKNKARKMSARNSERETGRIAPGLFWTGTAIVMIGLLVGMVSWLSLSGTAARGVSAVAAVMIDVGRDAGFTVAKVTLSGRRETSRQEVLNAVNVDIGDSMFTVPLAALSEDLARAGWIESVSVSRFWPNHVHIEVHERTPFALWQRDGVIALIDASGVVITEENVERFAHLPLLVGKQANERATEIVALIDLEPSLAAGVRAATYVGARRWNIRMNSGLEIKLPETGMLEAWRKVADLAQRFDLLLRDLEAIDLRLTDRTVVRLPAGVAPRARRSGQRT